MTFNEEELDMMVANGVDTINFMANRRLITKIDVAKLLAKYSDPEEHKQLIKERLKRAFKSES